MNAASPPRIVRWLVRLYPREFRDAHGAEVLSFCADRLAGASRRSLWLRVVPDLIAGAAVERVRSVVAPRRRGIHTSASPGMVMGNLGREVTFAFRSLRRDRGFAIAAMLTLALGIGATTAIFSVVYRVLLAPFPFPHADRVVVPMSYDFKNPSPSAAWSITYGDFMDWRDQHVFDKVAAYQGSDMDLTGAGDPVRVSVAAVTPQFFDVLGVGAAKGRVFLPGDYPVDAARAVIISDRLWRTQFGGRSDVVNSTIEVGGFKRPIVGVMPPDVRVPLDADAWVPFRVVNETDPDLIRRDNFVMDGIARLAPGVSLEATKARMARLAAIVAADHKDIRGTVSTMPVPLVTAALDDSTTRALWILLGAVGLLLLIGCVNVANLQLARAASRRQELALRSALGASRRRLIAQMLVESGLLAAAGCMVGIAIARVLIKVLVVIAPSDVPRIEQVSLEPTVAAFAVVLAAVVAILFGAVPALRAAATDPQEALAESGRRSAGSASRGRMRRALVVAELALSVVILAGAGLSIRSIANLRGTNTGFDGRNVVTASIALPSRRYDSAYKVVRFMTDLQARLSASSDVQGAGIASASPLHAGGFYLGRKMVREGGDITPAGEVSINWNVTTPGYFGALQIPFVQGRDFTVHDDSASPPVMIVNETFARQMFPGGNAMGKRAMSSRDEKLMRTVVGVVRDIRYRGVTDSARALVWVPYAQGNAWHQGVITVRGRHSTGEALSALRRELHAIDPAIAAAGVMTMDQALSHSIANDMLVTELLAAFAALALGLAAIGVFGVLAFLVQQRTREMGIRVALGARQGDVVRLVARETIPMVGVGVLTGLAAAFAVTRLLQSMFYHVTATDPVTFVGVVVLLGGIAVIAAIVPARRASRVDPATVLRGD